MTKTIAVRDVNEETFRKFRALAVEERMKLGDAMTEAMERFMKEEKGKSKKAAKDILKIKPVRVGKKKVRWSEEVDEVLYGGGI